jgi:GST-like protein
MIEIHFAPSPNSRKVTIMLEESGIPYRLLPLQLGQGDQFKPDYLRINPNHRMPTMVDTEPKDGGGPLSVFESGAIMLYLAEKSGKFMPQDTRGKYEVTQWIMWQMANQGPKFGECGHFQRLKDTKGDQSYAVRRFSDETNRLYGVMNYRLYDRKYLAGDTYTIADMICYPWAARFKELGEDIDKFKHFKRWYEDLSARPGVQRGMTVGADLLGPPRDLSPEEQARVMKILYNQRAIPAPDEARA